MKHGSSVCVIRYNETLSHKGF